MGDDERGDRPSDFPFPSTLKKSYEESERELLSTVKERVLRGNSLSEILETVFNTFGDILTFDRMALAFLEEEGKRVVCKFARTKYKTVYMKEGYSLDLAMTSLEKVLSAKSPRVISDLSIYKLQRRASISTEMLLREGLRSSMITPLYSEKKPLGFLFFNSTYPNAYGERELKILNELKDTLSFAIEKAYYIEELQKALDSYKELLNFVSHEIKNPISSLITQGRLLEQGFLGEMTPPQKEIVSKIVSKAEYLLGLVRNYLDLSRIEQGRLQINIKDNVNFIEEVVKEAISIALPQIEQKKMVFEQKFEGNQYPLSIDPNLIKIVVINLLGNGAQYGREGGKIELNVDFKNDGVYVSVKNEGEGFTEEAKSKLFRKFSRLETSKALGIKGTGLGLYITWWIVTQHKGWIDAVSELDKYAKFTFFLPRNI